MQETRVQTLDWEEPLEKEMATHSSVLAWEIPWAEKPRIKILPHISFPHFHPVCAALSQIC